MGKHRTSHSLLQEAMNRVSQLKVKVAESIVNDDPQILAIDEQISDIKRGMIKVNRWLDPQHGLSNSIEKWTVRIAEAKDNLANAEETKADMLSQISVLKAQRNKVAVELAKDAEVEAEAIVTDSGIQNM